MLIMKETKAPIPPVLLPLRIAVAALASIYVFAGLIAANPCCCHRKERSTNIAAVQAAQCTYTAHLNVYVATQKYLRCAAIRISTIG